MKHQVGGALEDNSAVLMSPVPCVLKELFASQVVLLDALLGKHRKHIEGIALVEVAAAIGAQMFVVVHWLSPLSSTSNLGGLIGCHRHNSIYRL